MINSKTRYYIICFGLGFLGVQLLTKLAQPACGFDAQLGSGTMRNIMAAAIAAPHLQMAQDEKQTSVVYFWAYRRAEEMLKSAR